MKKLPKVINISYKVDRINEKKISLIRHQFGKRCLKDRGEMFWKISG